MRCSHPGVGLGGMDSPGADCRPQELLVKMLMKPVYETVTKMLGAFLLALFITSPNQAQAAAPSEPSDPPPTNGSEEGQQGTSTASDQAQ